MLLSDTQKTVFISFLGLILAASWGMIFFTFFYPKSVSFFQKATFNAPTAVSASSSHAVTPVISNQWYSTLFDDFPSAPLYSLPLAFKATSRGLGFSYPDIQKTKNTIFAPYAEDFSAGYSSDFTKTHVDSISDWTVGASLMTADEKTLSFTIGHGMPFATLLPDDKQLLINFAGNYTASTDKQPITTTTFTTDAFMIAINNHFYIFALPQQTTIHFGKNQIAIDPTKKIFIGLLDKKEHFSLFKQISNVTIVDSLATPQVTQDRLNVLYKLTTENGTPLITLYPHQFDLLTSKVDILGTYQTLRGPLKLVKTDNFSLSLPLLMPNGTFTKLKKDYPDLIPQIKQDIQAIINQKPPDSRDYYLGTWFGKVSNLLLLADAYGLDHDKQQLLSYVEPIFADSLKYFSYDKTKTSIIADKPEFGNENLNDHHFHYGYYIRTASVITSFDLSFLPKIKNSIDDMVADVATTDRISTLYPYLRNFDIYEAHSWADGKGATPDGNNQESSSEAINCWYALYLWGKINNDTDLQKTGLYLYNMEIQSAYYYWFDIKNNYASPYSHAIASIVWGGKVDFATWFSGDTNMKYGIELLPITPASVYLGGLPSFVKYDSDYHASGGDETKDWGDLFAIWKSFYTPQQVISLKNKITKPESNTPRSLFLYMLYSNNENYQANQQLTPTPSILPNQ